MGISAQLGDQAAGGPHTDGEPFTQRLRRDRSLVLLPVQHVLGPRAMQQVLLPCARIVVLSCRPAWRGCSFGRAGWWHARHGGRGSVRCIHDRAGRWLGAGRGGLHGLQEPRADLGPSDQEEGSAGVEGGFAVVAGDEGFGDVQRQGDQAGEDEQPPRGADHIGGPVVQGQIPGAQKTR